MLDDRMTRRAKLFELYRMCELFLISTTIQLPNDITVTSHISLAKMETDGNSRGN